MMRRKIFAGTITATMFMACLLAQGCGNASTVQTQFETAQKKDAAAMQETAKTDNKSAGNQTQAVQDGEAADKEKVLQTEAASVQVAVGETQSAVKETEAAQQNGQPAVQPETAAVQDTPADSAPVSTPQQAPVQQNNTPQQNDTPVVQQQQYHHQHHQQHHAQYHTHCWMPQTTTIHHPAVTHAEPVCENVWVEDKAAWDEPVYESRIECWCGAQFSTYDDYNAHSTPLILNDDLIHGRSKVEKVIVCTIHHEAEGHYETQQTGTRTVVDTEAYDEEITSGYHCECGATR